MKIKFDRKTQLIQVVAPSSKTNLDKLISAVNEFQELVKDNSLKLKEFDLEDILSEKSLPFFSSDTKFRCDDFKQALEDKNVAIIWALRGGYGSVEVANFLKEYKIKSPKILIGFSDITSLHLLFNNFFKLPSIHGANLSGILKKDEKGNKCGMANLNDVVEILKRKKIECKYKLRKFLDDQTDLAIQGKIIGGNLTVICSNIGSIARSDDFNDKILFLEDINEAPYKIHRSLTQLYFGGFLNRIKAIIFGQFTDKDDRDENIDVAIKDFLNEYKIKIPTYIVNDIGHGKRNNALILGSESKIYNELLTIDNPFDTV